MTGGEALSPDPNFAHVCVKKDLEDTMNELSAPNPVLEIVLGTLIMIVVIFVHGVGIRVINQRFSAPRGGDEGELAAEWQRILATFDGLFETAQEEEEARLATSSYAGSVEMRNQNAQPVSEKNKLRCVSQVQRLRNKTGRTQAQPMMTMEARIRST